MLVNAVLKKYGKSQLAAALVIADQLGVLDALVPMSLPKGFTG